MKNSIKIILMAVFASVFLLSNMVEAENSLRNKAGILVFGGPAFVLQRVDTVVSYATVKSGPGGMFGAMITYKLFNASLAYAHTRHTMEVRDIPVSLDFSDVLLSLGCDFSTGGDLVPYMQACFGMTSLTDVKSEGFTGGMTLGVGTGFRGQASGRWGYLVNVMYGFNKYDAFSTTDASWADRSKIKGNYLMASASLTFRVK
jgi:hypothetical protein